MASIIFLVLFTVTVDPSPRVLDFTTGYTFTPFHWVLRKMKLASCSCCGIRSDIIKFAHHVCHTAHTQTYRVTECCVTSLSRVHLNTLATSLDAMV